MERKTLRKQAWIFILLCLLIGNIAWGMVYRLENDDMGFLLGGAITQFFPTVIALVLCMINNENLHQLKIRLNLKKAWKVCLLAIVLGLLYVYLDDPLQYFMYRENVYLQVDSVFYGLVMVMFIVIMVLVGSVILVGQEIGWLGYFFPKLEKLYGTNVAIIILAVIRTAWQAAAMLSGYDPFMDTLDMFVFHLFTQYLYVYLLKKSDSLLPTAIAHGLTNSAPHLIVYGGDFYQQNVWQIFIVSSIAPILVSVLCYFLMKKDGMLVKRTDKNVDWLGRPLEQ